MPRSIPSVTVDGVTIKRAAARPVSQPKTTPPKSAAPKAATPQPTSTPNAGWGPTTAAKSTAAAVSVNSADRLHKQFEAQANREWDNARPAPGWGGNAVEMRLLNKADRMSQQGAVRDERAFSRESWVAWRVPQLKQENQSKPDDALRSELRGSSDWR